MRTTTKASNQVRLNNGLGYFQIVFQDNDKQLISKLTKRMFTKKDLFKSVVVDYIDGDVTYDLHMTLFYGIKNEKLNLDDVARYLEQVKVNAVELGGIRFFIGYQNQYKVAYLEVVDREAKLSNLASSFKKFPFDDSVQYEIYKPHITLAYLKNNFNVDKFCRNKLSKIPLPKNLVVKGIEYLPE